MAVTNQEKVKFLSNLVGRKRSEVIEDMFTDKYTLMSEIRESFPDNSFQPAASAVEEDPYVSFTTETQDETENVILTRFKEIGKLSFNYRLHEKYLMASFYSKLPSGYVVLDANHPWLMYWLANAHTLSIKTPLEIDTIELINSKIEHCLVDEGERGIAGGVNQLGHAASTYSGILTLILTKNYQLLESIRDKIYNWLLSLKNENGSFVMHEYGEADTRSTYCVLVIASLLNLLTPELTDGVQDWLNLCQTYEGGFSGVPNTEAHGGYTFCALASYFILNTDTDSIEKSINVEKLLRWSVERQMSIEGGLNGRTNKLVDSCYSFWIGALFPMLEIITGQKELFNRNGLAHYILRCAQSNHGGFMDKPGKGVDFYHTNYALCGLSVCEYLHSVSNKDDVLAYRIKANAYGDKHYTLPVHPVFGIPVKDVDEARQYFQNSV
ncbi:beta subunit of protein farnesyltransferase [Spathaspora passalidarum NRRL Y-27907]|uniref:Protein farnesyltransferase subunit beta n=1 Tax=Spathaspora passalidarum (strain NRRL Y-27907 / 11-Y1) TaxID=619300 RepID=G3AH96_SPAPN|nr:beta subunit of protein farnesyltransferase [Spathaspora passalidarum NRRL Y-27907]EGW35526.1 beta subunit of protein farnesyltransferase [Spathaspora passalidarum NRRL Y-27907]